MNDPILEAPLEELLRPASEQADAERMWRSHKLRRQAEERRRSRRHKLAWGGGAATVLSAAAAFWFLLWTPTSPAGPLHLARGTADLAQGTVNLARGAVLRGTLESGAAPSSVELDDGSRILLDSESRAEIAVNEAHRLMTRLQRGGATFDVTPGGPRRWVVEAGETRVEVVGTRFSVTRRPAGVQVRVERGIVEVRAPSLPEVVRLTAGGSLMLPNAAPAASAETAAEAPTEMTSSQTSRPAQVAETAEPVTEHAGARPHAAHASTQALMRRADEARREGRFSDAAPLLARVVETAPGDPRAAVAAFSLGRLRLDRLGAPAEAARSFAFVRTHPGAGALREDATALEARARARAGGTDRARSLAHLYLSRFPEGRHSAEMRRLADAE